MTVTLTARIDMLEAALICVGHDKLRPYLNGVYVDPAGLVVATDGHRLFAGDFTPDNSRATLPAFEGWIIPRDALQRALKALTKKQRLNSPVLEISPERVGDAVCQPVDGGFPDWRRAVPNEVTPDGKTAQFDGAYLADFDKIATMLCGIDVRKKGYCTLHHNGDGPAPVTFGNAPAIGVLMPRLTFWDLERSPKHYAAFLETCSPTWRTKLALDTLKANDWKI